MYLELARKMKKKNTKVTMILIVIVARGIITKRLVKGVEDMEIRGRVETIQTTALLRLARILRRVLETRDLAVTQIPVRIHQLTLEWKTLKGVNY